MNDEQIEQVRARLKRILNRCGWTPHLWHKNEHCWYARAAKRGTNGTWNGKYIGPLHEIPGMSTEKIVAVLPVVA